MFGSRLQKRVIISFFSGNGSGFSPGWPCRIFGSTFCQVTLHARHTVPVPTQIDCDTTVPDSLRFLILPRIYPLVRTFSLSGRGVLLRERLSLSFRSSESREPLRFFSEKSLKGNSRLSKYFFPRIELSRSLDKPLLPSFPDEREEHFQVTGHRF